MYQLSHDIQNRIDHKFPNPADHKDVMDMMEEIGKASSNVGKDQLIRSILIIADTDKSKIRQILDSNFHGDPRDVIMAAMGIPGNSNQYGQTPFE